MILVTGGTGRLGRLVLEAIAEAELPVRALVRDLEKARRLDLPTVEFLSGDLGDRNSIARALDGVDRVVLISGFAPDMARLQIGFVKAAQAAAGRPWIVKLSGIGANPRGPTLMSRLHGEVEAELAASGLPWTCVRPSLFMQNFLSMAERIRTTGSFALPAADAAVAQIDARDIAAVVVRVLVEDGHRGKSYDLTGPEAFTYLEAAAVLSAVAGAPIGYVAVSAEAYKAELTQAGRPGWLVAALDELFAELRAGAGWATTDHVRHITRQPPRSVSVFARDHAHEFRAP